MTMREHTREQPRPNGVGDWVNLRDAHGRIQASYHPGLQMLIIKARGEKTMHDLRKFATPCESNTDVLG